MISAEASVNARAGRGGAVGPGWRLEPWRTVSIGRSGGLRQAERINAARGRSADPGRRGSAGSLAIRARVVVGQVAWREKSGAVIAVQSAVLAGKEISAAVFAHGRRAERPIGLACRHLGEQAFRRNHVLKLMFKKEEPNQKYVLYKAKDT